MREKIILMVCLMFVFSCNLGNKAIVGPNDFVTGDWTAYSFENDILYYMEVYIDKSEMYIFREGMLSSILEYEISENQISYFTSDGSQKSTKYLKVSNDLFTIFGEDKEVTYSRLSTGIRPSDFILRDQKVEYSEAFLKRERDSRPPN